MSRGKFAEEELKKITIRIFSSDHTMLRTTYPTMGHNEIIRRLIRKHCRQIEKRVQTKAPTIEDLSYEGEQNID